VKRALYVVEILVVTGLSEQLQLSGRDRQRVSQVVADDTREPVELFVPVFEPVLLCDLVGDVVDEDDASGSSRCRQARTATPPVATQTTPSTP